MLTIPVKLIRYFSIQSINFQHVTNALVEFTLIEVDHTNKYREVRHYTDKTSSSISLDFDTLEFFDIVETNLLQFIGGSLKIIFAVEPWDRNSQFKPNQAFMAELRHIQYHSKTFDTYQINPIGFDSQYTTYQMKIRTPDNGGSFSFLPCPRYQLFISLSKFEYHDLMEISNSTALMATISLFLDKSSTELRELQFGKSE